MHSQGRVALVALRRGRNILALRTDCAPAGGSEIARGFRADPFAISKYI